MTVKERLLLHLFNILCFIGPLSECVAQSVKINNNSKEKVVVFGNEKITVTVDYNKKANISLLIVNGQQVIQGDTGIYSLISTKVATYSTLHLSSDPAIKISNNTIRIM